MKKPRHCKFCGRKSYSVRLRKVSGELASRKSHYVCKKCFEFSKTILIPGKYDTSANSILEFTNKTLKNIGFGEPVRIVSDEPFVNDKVLIISTPRRNYMTRCKCGE